MCIWVFVACLNLSFGWPWFATVDVQFRFVPGHILQLAFCWSVWNICFHSF